MHYAMFVAMNRIMNNAQTTHAQVGKVFALQTQTVILYLTQMAMMRAAIHVVRIYSF